MLPSRMQLLNPFRGIKLLAIRDHSLLKKNTLFYFSKEGKNLKFHYEKFWSRKNNIKAIYYQLCSQDFLPYVWIVVEYITAIATLKNYEALKTNLMLLLLTVKGIGMINSR